MGLMDKKNKNEIKKKGKEIKWRKMVCKIMGVKEK
jgi:hypothetical protein